MTPEQAASFALECEARLIATGLMPWPRGNLALALVQRVAAIRASLQASRSPDFEASFAAAGKALPKFRQWRGARAARFEQLLPR